MPTLLEQAEALTNKAATLRSESIALAEKAEPTAADLFDALERLEEALGELRTIAPKPPTGHPKAASR